MMNNNKFMNFKKFTSNYRRSLDQLMRKRGMVGAAFFHEVESDIPSDIKVIGLPDTVERQMNCHGFTFEKSTWFETPKVYQLLTQGHLVQIAHPKPNCIALYIDTERKIPIIYHSAMYLGNGMVRSKWSNGPILEHKIFNAPYTYGENVRFYKLHEGGTN